VGSASPAALSEHPLRSGDTYVSSRPTVTRVFRFGDRARLASENRLGALMEKRSCEQTALADDELQDVMEHPSLPADCRATAEQHFPLEGVPNSAAAFVGKFLNDRAA